MSDKNPISPPVAPLSTAANISGGETTPTPTEWKGLKDIVYVLGAVMLVAIVSLIIQFMINSAVAQGNFDVQIAEQNVRIENLTQVNALMIQKFENCNAKKTSGC